MSISTTQSDADRALIMQRAYRSYTGKPPVVFQKRIGEPDDNLLLSLSRLIVDKGVSFLFGQDVQSQVTDDKSEPRQDWLDECWRRNKRALTLQKIATNGGICGHAFARLVDTKPWPRVIGLDPQTVVVETDVDDIDTVWKYTITPPPQQPDDESEPPVRRRTIIQTEQQAPSAERDSRWTVTDQSFSGGAWVNAATARWPYPFSPIVDCQNLPKANEFWGESDLPDDVGHVLDAINRVASHYNKIIRLHAHPKIWTRGMGTRLLDIAIDTVINLPSETAELQALEMHSDLASTKALLDELLNVLSMMVRIPLVAMGMPDNLGAISGVALQIRYQPLVEKTTTKQRTYGDLLQELDRRLLALGGYGDTTITTLHWHDILPVDPLLESQVLVIQEALGVMSRQTISEKLGLDYDAEQSNLLKEAQDSSARQAVVAPPIPQAPAAVPGEPGVPYPAVPPPQALQAPVPDIAKKASSK